MEKEKLDFYESPLVEVIEVEVEKGFATSGGEQQEESPWGDM